MIANRKGQGWQGLWIHAKLAIDVGFNERIGADRTCEYIILLIAIYHLEWPKYSLALPVSLM